MVKVNWTRQAIEDIYEIREYFNQHASHFAEQLTEKIFEKASGLEKFPQMGRIVPELGKPDVRELIFRKYRIIYRVVSKQQVDILAVHSGFRPLSEESIF